MESVDINISDADYKLSAQYDDACRSLQSLEYQAAAILLDARRKVERLRTATEQARARVRRLTPAHRAMCARIRVDWQTGLDIEDEVEELDEARSI